MKSRSVVRYFIYTKFIVFLLFFSSTFLLFSPTNEVFSAGTGGERVQRADGEQFQCIDSRNPNGDGSCVCAVNQCRLSVLMGEWYDVFDERAEGSFQDGVEGPGQYKREFNSKKLDYDMVCVGADYKLEQGNFTNFTSQMSLQTFDPGFFNKRGEWAERTGTVTVFHDQASVHPSDWFLPLGTECRVDDKTNIAYWFNPNYFDPLVQDVDPNASADVIGENASFCSPPLLTDRDLFNNEVSGTETFFGCLPNSVNGAVAFTVRIIFSFIGLIVMVIIFANLYKIITQSNNPEAIAESRKKALQALMIAFVIFFALTILSVLGLTILDLGTLSGSFAIFTGG